SAGRVQSVATRLVVDRERERIAFVPVSYWDLDLTLDGGESADPRLFPARLVTVGGRKVAAGRDFNAQGQSKDESLLVLDEQSARQVADALRTATATVQSVDSKPYSRRPYEPFRT